MATEFDTQVTLYKCVPFDNTYKNVYYVSNPTRFTMDTFLDSYDSGAGRKAFSPRTVKALSFQRKEQKMRLPLSWYEADTYNYLRFINPSSYTGSIANGQIYYAFITHTEYVNDVTTEITFEIDYFATYFTTGQVKISGCMVERETVYDDAIGRHIEPEPISPGDAIPYYYADLCKTKSQGQEEGYIFDLTKMCVIVLEYTTKITGGLVGSDSKSVNGTLSDGIYSGATLHAFNTSTKGLEALNKFLTDEVNENTADNCIVYMAPYAAAAAQSGLGEIPDGGVQLPSTDSSALEGITMQNEDFTGIGVLDDAYEPKNNKLYTYPYHYFQVDNGNGGKLVIPYEQCGPSGLSNGDSVTPQYWDIPEFYIWMTLTPPVTVTLKWMNQRGGGWGTHTLALTGYPTCAWSASSFARWWAQSCGKNVASIINTGISTFGMAAGAGVAAEAGNAESAAEGNINATATGITGVVNAAATVWQAAHSPDYVNGNLSNGNALVSAREQYFHASMMSIPHQRAKQIDDFFTKYGYQVMEYKTPRLVNRKFYDYLKTQDALVIGEAPTEAISTIEGIFNRGVTLWHCGATDVGKSSLVNDALGTVE